MSNAERIRALRTLLVMALSVVVVILLGGCAFAPPYPEYVLDDADPWINSIKYLPDHELQEACVTEARVIGCGDLTSGEIFVLDDPGMRDCILRHEKSHFREVFVERVSYAESAAHTHWSQHSCYAKTAMMVPAPGIEPGTY